MDESQIATQPCDLAAQETGDIVSRHRHITRRDHQSGATLAHSLVALRGWIEQGKSLLLASHILHEVESITRSFLLICGGRLLASGTAEEVHEMLVDLPNDLTLRCDKPHRLARLVVEKQMADSLRIESDRVCVSTRHPAQLLAELPDWVAEEQIEINEVRSADESLQELFNSLLKIHRGEI